MEELIAFEDNFEFNKFIIINDNKYGNLSLSSLTRCLVVNILVCDKGILLFLNDVDFTESTTCLIQENWSKTTFKISDTIVIKATKCNLTKCSCQWFVDNKNGVLVYCPDILLSPSRIVYAVECNRRGILQNKFKERGFSLCTVVGKFVHLLFQKTLDCKAHDEVAMIKLVNNILSAPSSITQMYGAMIDNQTITEELKSQLLIFVPIIKRLIENYFLPSGKKEINYTHKKEQRDSKNHKIWRGKICAVRDIEECIIDPKLGLFGFIDVTVDIINDEPYGEKIYSVPLELKTGKSMLSVEHSRQVALYTLMKSSDQGLLANVRDEFVTQIKPPQAMTNGLLQVRNRLVSYMEEPSLMQVLDKGGRLEVNLPPANPSKETCKFCPVKTACGLFMRNSKFTDFSDEIPPILATKHLNSDHIKYFCLNSFMLCLEEKAHERRSRVHLKDIWNVPAVLRELNGTCLTNMNLLDQVQENKDGCFIHVFTRTTPLKLPKSSHESNFSEDKISESCSVVISTKDNLCISSGIVKLIENCKITLSLDKDLQKNYAGNKFNIDKKTHSSLFSDLFTNLAELMIHKPYAQNLRELLIEKKHPTPIHFDLTTTDLKLIKESILSLNYEQQSFIAIVNSCKGYAILQGNPGTGKTETIATLIKILASRNKSVLVTSHTHSAVDNILIRLQERGVDFLRIGSEHKIDNMINPNSILSQVITQCKSPEELDTILNEKQVVGCTALGLNHPLFFRRRFDYCIVDESTQVNQPTVIRPLLCADTFVLVGDSNQLPPLVLSDRAKRLGLGESLLVRLAQTAIKSGAFVELKVQYRMNKNIMNLANKFKYNGTLKCANQSVARATLKLDSNVKDLQMLYINQPWLVQALSPQLEFSVIVLNTGNIHSKCPGTGSASTFQNVIEAFLVDLLLDALLKGKTSQSDIAVISPYRVQVKLLQRVFRSHTYIDINTVDQYQGRDKPVVILSCSQSSVVNETSEVLNDDQRLAVAITRSRHKLIIIGNISGLIGKYKPFSKLIKCIPELSILNCESILEDESMKERLNQFIYKCNIL